jgi:hypothetical protein
MWGAVGHLRLIIPAKKLIIHAASRGGRRLPQKNGEVQSFIEASRQPVSSGLNSDAEALGNGAGRRQWTLVNSLDEEPI